MTLTKDLTSSFPTPMSVQAEASHTHREANNSFSPGETVYSKYHQPALRIDPFFWWPASLLAIPSTWYDFPHFSYCPL